MKNILKLIGVGAISIISIGCTTNLRFINIQYEGFELPANKVVYIQQGFHKQEIMKGDHNWYTGYYNSEDKLEFVVKDKRDKFKTVGYISLLEERDEVNISCNKELTLCSLN